ncbi:regulatory sensor-transducer, BlaR1/MecR1 family / TonB-dependent receptor [Nonlabens marinus S1-08]|uniref:Regulatory sensor-transducer, BlaR1/MecR1 family / TonB-dependent receptor n=1 Tax=Nonlabens marinus S1-08 TaxID=1454201 RepID=W8VQR6_9FLAO|nr:regulatory sensor-transducer, BlaR1/MecR1 family / TonB-dependent receptor [Nonlabens marinus S1-08]
MENTSLHQFKRMYLLAAIVISVVIPFMVVKTVVLPLPSLESNRPLPTIEQVSQVPMETIAVENTFTIDWTSMIVAVYVIGLLIMLYRFVKNLNGLRLKSTDQLDSFQNYKLILRPKVVVPHSFWNTIYVNRKDYQAGKIPLEVLQHEKAHLDQKHSIDIFLIELLLVLAWFNPLIYVIKYSIKLNHEFLADQAVIAQEVDVKTYQETLLQYAAKSQNRTLANTFNFPLIKKRFTIMKTNTTTASGLLRSLAIIPVLALLLISCGQEEFVVEPEVIEIVEETPEEKRKPIYIDTQRKEGTITIDDQKYTFKRTEDKIKFYDSDGNEKDLEAQGHKIEIIEIEEVEIVEEEPEIIRGNKIPSTTKLFYKSDSGKIIYDGDANFYTADELQKLKNELKDDILVVSGEAVFENKSYYFASNLYEKVFINELNEIVDFEKINGKNVEIKPFLQIPSPPPAQKNKSLEQALQSSVKSVTNEVAGKLYAVNTIQRQDSTHPTKQMMAEYKELIRNSYKGSDRIWKNSDLEKMTKIYAQMSPSQKSSVEKLPAMLSFDLNEVQPNQPSLKQFEGLKNKSEYAVWIDGKVIDNNVLEQYTYNDFIHFTKSKVYKNARSSRFPQPFQVSLFTKNGFERTFRNKVGIK